MAQANETDSLEKNSMELLEEFIATKRLEGRSDQTLFFISLRLKR